MSDMMRNTIMDWDREQWAIACAWYQRTTKRTPVEFGDFVDAQDAWKGHHNYEPSPVENTLIVPFGFRQEKDVDAFGRLMTTPEVRLAILSVWRP